MANIAFLGLGVMGFPMAGHLVAAGHSVTVWNRTPAKSQAWAAKYAGHAAQLAVDAILGAAKLMHTVIASECTGCDLCVEPCPVDCIDMLPEQESLRTWHWDLPDPVVRKVDIIASDAGQGQAA